MKIGDSEYTVHALIAVDAKGDRYYDHNLISIEKENLLDLLSQAEINNGFGTTPDTKSTTVTGLKFNKLISILQSLSCDWSVKDNDDLSFASDSGRRL